MENENQGPASNPSFGIILVIVILAVIVWLNNTGRLSNVWQSITSPSGSLQAAAVTGVPLGVSMSATSVGQVPGGYAFTSPALGASGLDPALNGMVVSPPSNNIGQIIPGTNVQYTGNTLPPPSWLGK